MTMIIIKEITKIFEVNGSCCAVSMKKNAHYWKTTVPEITHGRYNVRVKSVTVFFFESFVNKSGDFVQLLKIRTWEETGKN